MTSNKYMVIIPKGYDIKAEIAKGNLHVALADGLASAYGIPVVESIFVDRPRVAPIPDTLCYLFNPFRHTEEE